jgi:hypothetical protein
MDWMNTIIFVCTIAIFILSCITVYINFHTIRLMKRTGRSNMDSSQRNTLSKTLFEEDRSHKKDGLDDRPKG